jgi:hypothetical protein
MMLGRLGVASAAGIAAHDSSPVTTGANSSRPSEWIMAESPNDERQRPRNNAL